MRTFRVTQKSLRARELALELMAKHGLGHLEFGFNRAKRKAGQCLWTRDGGVAIRIELSVHFVERNLEEEVWDTILHEIAHALAGPEAGHGPAWQEACRRIGARPERCFGHGQVNMPKGRWRATCPSCSLEYHRHRKPRVLLGWSCKNCGREKGQLVWRQAESASTS